MVESGLHNGLFYVRFAYLTLVSFFFARALTNESVSFGGLSSQNDLRLSCRISTDSAQDRCASYSLWWTNVGAFALGVQKEARLIKFVQSYAPDPMSTQTKKEIQLEIAHVLFIDIVGYSKLSINEQNAAVDELTQIVRST